MRFCRRSRLWCTPSCGCLPPQPDPSRRRLRSSSSDARLVRQTRLATIRDRAFPAAASRPWDELPGDITASQSLTVLRRQLKTVLYRIRIHPNFCSLLGVFADAVELAFTFALTVVVCKLVTAESIILRLLRQKTSIHCCVAMWSADELCRNWTPSCLRAKKEGRAEEIESNLTDFASVNELLSDC